MKPFLCIDISENRKNRNINEAFVCQKVSQYTKDNLDNLSLEMRSVYKKIRLPLPIKILQMIDGVVMVILLRAGLGLVMDDGAKMTELISKNIWFPFAFIGSIAVFVFLFLLERRQQIKLSKSEQFVEVNKRAENMESSVKAELGVPEESKSVDILTFTYTTGKNSAIKPIKVENFEYYVFTQNDNLYIADMERKCCIPLTQIDSITVVNKHLDLPFWNKETQYNKGEYTQYKITKNDCFYRIKKYCVMNAKYENEVWGIYFPCYELPVFEELTGVKAK